MENEKIFSDKENIINVLISSDNNVAKYLPVIMASVFENHKEYIVNFWLLHHKVLEDNILLMSQTADKYNQYFHEIVVDPNLFSHNSFSSDWPVECFYYFLAHQYLSDKIDRAIYLDSDQCCFGDFSEYYFSDFEDNYLMAAGGFGKEEKVKEVLDEETRIFTSTKPGAIFCTGSLMINFKKFREERIEIDYLIDAQKKRLMKLKNEQLFADQGLANYLFFNSTKFFPPKYQSTIWGLNKNTFDQIKIFHFMGRPKPWDEYFESPFYEKYSPNVFENYPFWVTVVRKWWYYASLCNNYEQLVFESKSVFYQKLETMFRKYVSQKSLGDRLKKSNQTKIPLNFNHPLNFIVEADATAWGSGKNNECRYLIKERAVNYKSVKFPLDCVLKKETNYTMFITASGSKSLELPIFLSDYRSTNLQKICILKLHTEYITTCYTYTTHKDLYDYLVFFSDNIETGIYINIKNIIIIEQDS